MAFARTKIQPPRARAGTLIDRPAHARRLGEALPTCRLVLLCAAAGFGKTTALAQQIDRLPAGTALAWISCDEGDAPAQLFECLVAALEPYDPPWLAEPQALLRAVVAADTSRDESPLALARLRAREEIAEFRIDELRFEAAEAQALGVALGLDGAAALRLQQRADGWPVGLRLALNALRGAPGSALAPSSALIDRHVFDFLAAEVIDRLDPALRDFLLLSSPLPALTATRCAALTGDAQAALRLEAIERAGLFTTRLDAAEPTWRLHDLFREVLEARLERERPELPAAGETDTARRVAWLQRAGAWDEAEPAVDFAVRARPSCVLQADVHGFGALMQDGRDRPVRQALERAVRRWAPTAAVAEVGAGDSVLIAADDPIALAQTARHLVDDVYQAPGQPRLRVALHYGTVHTRQRAADLARIIVGGDAVLCAARVEPVVEPGQVWATEEFRQQLQERPSLWRTVAIVAPGGDARFNVGKGGASEPEMWVRLYRLEF